MGHPFVPPPRGAQQINGMSGNTTHDPSALGPDGPRLYLCSSAIERDAAFPDGIPDGVLCEITGVGLIDAAIETARHIDRHRPSEVVYLGTCGAHRASGIAIGDIVVASEIAIGSGDVAAGMMRLPSLLVARLATDPRLSGELLGALAESGSPHVPAAVGDVVGEWDDAARPDGRARGHLARAAGRGDGWPPCAAAR